MRFDDCKISFRGIETTADVDFNLTLQECLNPPLPGEPDRDPGYIYLPGFFGFPMDVQDDFEFRSGRISIRWNGFVSKIESSTKYLGGTTIRLSGVPSITMNEDPL